MYDALGAEDPGRITLWLAHHEGDLVAATIAVRVGTHAWYSYGASSTDKRDVRGSNAVQWAMIRDAIAAGAEVYDLRGITDTLDADDPHVGLIQFKVGTGGEAVETSASGTCRSTALLYKGFELYMNRRSLIPRRVRMSLTLTVDGERWRAHLRQVADDNPGPGAGGQGQRLRLRPRPAGPQGRLARRRHPRGRHLRRAARGRPALLRRPAGAHAVAPDRRRCPPRTSRPAGSSTPSAGSSDLVALLDRDPHARIVLERLTSMRRHGMSAEELPRGRRSCSSAAPARLEGVAFHLPLAAGAHLSEVVHLVNDVVAAGLPTRTAVGQPPDGRRARLAAHVVRRLRRCARGSAPTSGSATATRCTVTATVLDVHEVERGDVFGYRGRTAPKAGHILVVSGGTAHGIGLEAPTGDHSIRARAATLARGGLDAVGFVRSPFTVDGKLRLFAEPPHMQASMLFLPHGPRVPAVGEEIDGPGAPHHHAASTGSSSADGVRRPATAAERELAADRRAATTTGHRGAGPCAPRRTPA